MLENNSYEYIKKIGDTYKENISITGMLETFKCMSDDYNNLNNEEFTFTYSDYDYNQCSKDEQDDFFNDQLQFIECLVTNTIYDRTGTVWNWKDIYNLLYNSTYSLTEKINRKVVYSTQSNNRPIGDISFQMWNGLQIIDLDIKDAAISEGLKPLIFDELKKYNWFLGVCKSASGKGLHVWTKITPISVEFRERKIEYLCNFRHKYSYVYIILDKYKKDFGYTKENIYNYMDLAMAKPQQGIFISSDTALLNTNFKDLRLDVNFEGAFNCGVSSIDWISHPDIKQIFAKLDWFGNETFDKETSVKIKDIDNINDRDEKKAKGPKHYKHNQRWQLANTLTNIYGEDDAFRIMCQICKETSTRELRGDVKTAAIHNKPISLWAINELNKVHGFNLKIKSESIEELKTTEEEVKQDEINDETKVGPPYSFSNPVPGYTDKIKKVVLHMTSDQYLGNIKDDIVKNLSHITLIEAGAGYGKTEMIKALKSKTLLILPFTSTIKSKVEASETTKDWLYFYGNNRPQISDLLGPKSMSMTIDKFSRLNIYELDQANFEYIVIDESHLLFTSSYREVMGPCIQRIANCKAKVILMTGTPTGETIFFPKIKYIRVIKDDLRIKECQINMVPTVDEQFIDMCNAMADDVINGVKILFPTNGGMTYYEQVTGTIQRILNEKGFSRPLKHFYYKKSHYGEESMDTINIKNSVGDNDIICCTTYLSVGIDIKDRSRFSIYFNTPLIPQDIEQYANRVRNNDLYIKIFLPRKDHGGEYINYYYTDRLDLGFNKKDLLFARDLIKTCNDVLERNEEESKYSPLLSSLLTANRFLKYDENDCKYYIDETAYKLKVFEERYSDWATQLEIMKQGFKYYGYTVIENVSDKEILESRKDEIHEFLRQCKQTRYNEVSAETRKFLSHIDDSNIDDYRELLRGNYDIFKSDDPEMVKRREDGKLYTNSIEILEKNTPIVLSLYKYYDCDTIRDIYDFCTEKKADKINFSKLQRIRQFANINSSIKKKRLDFPIYKFFKEAREWAETNYETTQINIDHFVADWAAKYCNSVKDVVIDDRMYLEEIYNMLKELWTVIIIQSRPRKGLVNLKPFELLWQTKQELNDIYGTMNTQLFFMEQLVNEMKNEEDDITIEEEVLPDLPMTEKKKLEDIEDEISEIVHETYEYEEYSKLDGSNDRFIRKQENTNQLRDNIFDSLNDIMPTPTPASQLGIFSDEDFIF